MTGKVPKAKVHYREGTEREHCGICTMFRAPHGCTLVAGPIFTDDTCDEFVLSAKKREK